MSRLVVFDIDDTIFDWLTMWSSSFSGLLAGLEKATGLATGAVREKIRTFHQSVGTSEFPFSSTDLSALFSGLGHEDAGGLADVLATDRRIGHQLFTGISDLFADLVEHGDRVVLHTDAPSALAATRCETLGIDTLVTCVYATKNDRYPAGPIAQIGCELITLDARKPDPNALRLIMAQNSGVAESTVVIGDSLFRDIAMAKACGAKDIYAKYGCDRQSSAYNLLRDVSHWTTADVEAERVLRHEIVSPSYTAESVADLSDILRRRR